MKKKRGIIISFLAVIIVILLIANLLLEQNNKNEKVNYATKKEIIKNYNQYLKEHQLITKSLKESLIKSTKEKEVYQLEENCYFVIGLDSKKKQIEKVYLYIKKDNKRMEEYLYGMVEATLKNKSKKEIKSLVSKMMENKKANELEIRVDFKKDGYQYMTVQKENGAVFNYFIYYDKKA